MPPKPDPGRDTTAGSNEPPSPWQPPVGSGTISGVSPKFAELRAEVLQLPEKERLRLADELYDSVEQGPVPDLSPAWKAEISRRLKSIEDGTAVLHDHDEVVRELLAKYGG